MSFDPRFPPAPLPDYMHDTRSEAELARDEYVAGRLSVAELEWHLEHALAREMAA